MYVMSPFTSLLVLENDEMYEQYNVDRGRKDHWALYPCPERIDVVHEPLHGTRPEVSADPHDTPTKPSLEEVLASLLVQTDSSGNITKANTHWMPRVVHVPDGGTVLFGGIKRHGDINGNGIPLLDKLPYVNRLFRNGHFYGEPDDVMLMITPRVIIQEEEEALLGFGDLSFAEGRRWDVDNDGDGAMTEFHSLIQLIDSTVSPDTWEAVGGSGSINAFPSNLSLAISQTQRIHDPIPVGFQNLGTVVYPVGDLVIPITQAHQGDFGTASVFTDGTSNTHLWNELSRRRGRYLSADRAGTVGASEQRIWKQLDAHTEFKYHDMHLKDVIADLRQRHDIPIVINSKAIEQYGIKTDSPITMNVSGISLRSGLRLILAQFDLTYFITDDVLQITTPEDKENQLVSRNYGFDEMLLLLRRGNSNSSLEHGSALDDPRRVDPRRVDRRAQILNQRMSQEATQPSLLYPQPGTVAKRRSFRRLVAFAPATTTTKADALAVLEAEASLKNRPEPGRVDEAARKLIEAARGWGWQVFTLRGPDNRVVLEVTMDGLGRFRFDHLTEHGLRETVVCNGETLRHLYPELGLGTTRSMSRFHRAGLTRLVPWLLPTVDDLAVGADLRSIGPRTVAIAPHGVGEQDEEGHPPRHVRLHLEFSADGRLAERRVVEMPSAKTIVRVAYSEDGTVRWFDGDNKQHGELHISIEKADAPNLTPDVDALVVLPMPVRDRGHVYKVAKVGGSESSTSTEQPDALRTIASDEQNRATDPAHWNEEDALRLLAANHLQNAAELRDVIGRRFFARGDRRIGFYALLLSSGERWDADERVKLSDGTTTRMRPLSDHPKSTLARYIDCQLRKTRFDLQDARYSSKEGQRGFILQLVEYRQLAARWSLPNGPPEDAETRRRELDQLFDFLSRCDSPKFAFVLLRRLQQRYGNFQPHGRIAEALIELEKHGTTSYAVKYELARSLASRGEKDKARSLFIELYRETLDEGILPPIDKSFATAMQGVEDPFDADDNGKNGFSGLMRGACTQLIDRKQRPLAIALAWQCRQLDEVSLGDILINQVLTGVPDDEQLGTTLGALEYLVSAGQHDRADALLKSLLSSQPYADSPALWRLAAVVASDGGRLARSISHLERAMDLEYENLPKRYNVEQVRQHYGELFARYHELAEIVAQSKSDVPVGLVARAIKVADRWRSLDTDVTAACNDAASVLSELGMDDLAWDYLTTPLAMKPNEATAWLNLAQTLRNDGDFELADRAYATAFEAEPTNAQILWDHAQLLEQTGRSKEARTIYRRIANGQWQPRFNPIKRRAERIKSRDSD